MIEDAKKCWFTACLEDGIPIPEPPEVGKSLSLELPHSLHALLAQGSFQKGISINQYCVDLISKGLAG